MNRAIALVTALLLPTFMGGMALAGDAPMITGIDGVVLRVPSDATTVYHVYLYEGDSGDPTTFYANRKLLASTIADTDGRFQIIAQDLPTTALTVRVKDSANQHGGDSVLPEPGPQGWPAVISGIQITPTPQADPRFGIQINNYARQRMYFITDRFVDASGNFTNADDPAQALTIGTFMAHVALGPGQASAATCGIAPDWKCDGPQITNDDSFVDGIATSSHGGTAQSALPAALANPAGNTILVFVHGYNTSFYEGASTAARLSYLMEPAPHTTLYYSWPSQNTAHGYPQDKNNADKSAKTNLVWVLDELTKLPSHPKIILAAHSMGSYAMTTALYEWALAHSEASGVFDRLILFAADVDVSLWKQTYEPQVGRVVKSIRFYSNANDQALRASKCTTGDDVDRIGEIVRWAAPPPPPTVVLTAFDATPFASTNDFGHGYITSSTSVALNWNSEVDPTPMADQKRRTEKLSWLQDGGGNPINWDSIGTTVLCTLWSKLP